MTEEARRCVEASQQDFIEALSDIVFYDGHKDWLMKLADDLEDKQGIVPCPFNHKQWHSEEHVIWMILVGMFGDWGTSIRGGWIERNKEAAEFIRNICSEEV